MNLILSNKMFGRLPGSCMLSAMLTEHDCPRESISPLKFSYNRCSSGPETNLLIFLHGLGDTMHSLMATGQSLNLPQTCILSVQGRHKLPMDLPGWSYFEKFLSEDGILENPDQSQAIKELEDLVDCLIKDCLWTSEQIHIFGYGQGASLGLSLSCSRQINSVVALGEFCCPTTVPSAIPLTTKIFASGVHGRELSRIFRQVTKSNVEGLPTKEDWFKIMSFWAENMRRRGSWELNGEWTEVR